MYIHFLPSRCLDSFLKYILKNYNYAAMFVHHFGDTKIYKDSHKMCFNLNPNFSSLKYRTKTYIYKHI